MPLLKNNELKDLASALGKAMVSPTLNFSYAGETLSLNSLDSAFRDQMRILCGYDEVTGRQDVHVFEQNEPLVYSLMETVINEAAPKKVEQQYKGLCEFKRFGENERPVFRLRVTNASRRRALKFISRGAIAGIYDAFELAGDVAEGKIFDLVGAGRISYMNFITGEFTMTDVMDIILEGFDKRVIEAISSALVGLVKNLQTQNKKGATGFSADLFDSLLSIADTYGTAPSYIFCTKLFAQKLFPYTTGTYSAYTDEQKAELFRNGGWLRNYKGMHPIVIIEQSYEDETYTKKVMKDGLCLIMPNNGLVNGLPIKIGEIGSTHVRRRNTTDWALEVEAFKQYSVTIVCDNDLFAYIDTSLLEDGESLTTYSVETA